MIFCFVATLLLSACASQDRTAYTPPPPPRDPHTQMVALETRIFELVQDERRKLDPAAKTLAMDSELVGVARKRSADMAAKDYMQHAGPDGTTSTTLIMDQDADFQGLLGENIAAQYYTPRLGVDVDAFAKKFVAIWEASPDNRAMFTTPQYDRSGVGAAVNDNEVFVVQLFATNLGLPPPPHDPHAPPGTPVPQPRPEHP
ncbi:MAG: CAP domain-containing protein [Rhizomicrobium sp.]